MIDLRLGHTLEQLRAMPDESVQCIVTSPPYWGLRAYGTDPQVWLNGHEPCAVHQWESREYLMHNGRGDAQKSGKFSTQEPVADMPKQDNTCAICGAWRGELGLEPMPEMYVTHLVQIFREARRVLRDDGTLWLNLGDSYAGSLTGADRPPEPGHTREKDGRVKTGNENKHRRPNAVGGAIKPKDLIGIPWRVAFALQADGWYLRQDIIWAKPNPMPESVRDRCTKAHEYVFLMSKSPRYYYDADAVAEPAAYDGRKDEQFKGSIKSYDGVMPDGQPQSMAQRGYARWNKDDEGNRVRNKRSVWTVTTHPFKEAHFATFPPKLIEPMILAGCPVGGTVLDPFNGSGTTGLVATQLGRNYIGIELKPEYVEMTKRRIAKAQPALELVNA